MHPARLSDRAATSSRCRRAGEHWKSKQQIQRFRITDGNHERFTEIKENAGHIQLYEWPEKQVPEGTSVEPMVSEHAHKVA